MDGVGVGDGRDDRWMRVENKVSYDDEKLAKRMTASNTHAIQARQSMLRMDGWTEHTKERS